MPNRVSAGAAHDVVGADIEQRRGAGQREVALPAGKFMEAVAMTLPPERQIDRGDHFVRRERSRHEARAKFVEGDLPDAAHARDVDDRIVGGADGGQFGGGIGVRQAAADGAAIAGLTMPDMAERLGHQRAKPWNLGDVSMSRWRVMAPMRRRPSPTTIPRNSSTPPRSTR